MGKIPDWRKSRFSTIGNCVEVRRAEEGGVRVRDSKNPSGAELWFTRDEWLAFTAGMKSGEFDYLTEGAQIAAL